MNGQKRNNFPNGGVPPRWLKCPRKSTEYIAEKFLVFKTPLSRDYDDFVSLECRFYPQMIIDYVKNNKESKMKIGLWIDLTNTDRFYPCDDIISQGIKYVKVNCRGHGEAPSAEQVKIFNRLCIQFMDKYPDDIIGVHCTHGFNRSGYLVCAFLTEVWDWDVVAAITHFRDRRPPGIYKQQYINQLYETYATSNPNEEPEPIPLAPDLPEWCYEDHDEKDDDGYAATSNVGRRRINNDNLNYMNGSKRRKAEVIKKNPTFMEGVSGVYPIMDLDRLSILQRRVQDMCEWAGVGFPGSQPVSMDIKNLRMLAEKPYMVSWKADGTRYLMLIDGPGEVYFIDRDNCVFHAPDVSFRYRKDLEEHLSCTLVDGEMVLDKVKDAIIPRYLIYDVIKFRGEDTGKTDFRVRLNCIRDELIGPRTAAMEKGIIDRNSEPFGVRFKTFWFLQDTEKILTGRFAKELIHEPDGVIFQPVKEPYKPGRCDEVLKWKPPHLNTVDFRVKIVEDNKPGMLRKKIGELYVGGLDHFFGIMKVTKANSYLKPGAIVECKYDRQTGLWMFLRERTDKSFPNAYSTAQAVCASIMNPVTQEVLLDFIAHRRYVKH